MLQFISQDLLARGEDEWVKFVIGAIAVVIWLLSSLGKALGKKPDSDYTSDPVPPPDFRSEDELQRSREEMARRLQDIAGVPVKTAPLPQIPQPPRPAQKKQQPRRKPKKPIPAPVAPRVPEHLPVAQPLEPVTEIPNFTSPSSGASISANAAALNRWLRPPTLRQQFILTEILQKPVALRPEHLDDH